MVGGDLAALLISLLRLQTDRRCIEAIAEELLFAKVRPRLDAVEATEEVRLFRGVRQGNPLSGLLFIMIMSVVLRPLESRWSELCLRCRCGKFRYTHLLFADDLVLIGKDGREILHMLDDLQRALEVVGLETNGSKFQYVHGHRDTNMEKSTQSLPGTDPEGHGDLGALHWRGFLAGRYSRSPPEEGERVGEVSRLQEDFETPHV